MIEEKGSYLVLNVKIAGTVHLGLRCGDVKRKKKKRLRGRKRKGYL